MRRYTATPFSIAYLVFDFIEGLLLLRFLFKILGANAGNALIGFLYRLSEPLVYPFRGIFPNVQNGAGSVFEWNTLLAIVAYALIATIIVSLLNRVVVVHHYEEDVVA